MSRIIPKITFTAKFGSQGTGNGQFDFPSGITELNDEIYVVDRQNHRVQVFDLDGVYVRKFGTIGSGNDQFYFPEGIATDGTNLFIVDSANHRVKITDNAGVYVAQFGTVGSGDANFSYPKGIDIDVDDNAVYICDTQNHRIKKHNATTYAFISEFGSYGTTNGNLNFPEDIALCDDGFTVADSGNHTVKVFTSTGVFIRRMSNKTFHYPVGLVNVTDFLGVLDKSGCNITMFDCAGEVLFEYGSPGSTDNDLYFPQYAVYYATEEKLYVTDSGNHRILILNVEFLSGLGYAPAILKLSRQLYPTGRAWWMPQNNVMSNLHEALSYSESEAVSVGNTILNSILPDNDDFTAEDAFNWESALGIFQKPDVNIVDRKAAILRAMRHPGVIKARQHHLYLQGQLQTAGFDVYVIENRVETTPGSGIYEVTDPETVTTQEFQLGLCEFDVWEFGGEIPGLSYTILANYTDEAKDATFFTGQTAPVYTYTTQLRATFFVSGSVFPSMANVPANRKEEFRQLILKLKPAQSVGFLFINYI